MDIVVTELQPLSLSMTYLRDKSENDVDRILRFSALHLSCQSHISTYYDTLQRRAQQDMDATPAGIRC